MDDRSREWEYSTPVRPDFGPTGHDYTRASDDETSLEQEEISQIDALLAERLEVRRRGGTEGGTDDGGRTMEGQEYGNEEEAGREGWRRARDSRRREGGEESETE